MIIWNTQKVDCVPIETHAQVIHCRVTNKINAQSLCSFVYGASSPAAREDLWSNLISWGINHAKPWMLIADYNIVLSLDERKGSLNPHAHDMEKFLSCTTTLGLDDAPSIGNLLTWTNGTLWSKIDKVLLNAEWQSSNLRCLAEFMDFMLGSYSHLDYVSCSAKPQNETISVSQYVDESSFISYHSQRSMANPHFWHKAVCYLQEAKSSESPSLGVE